MKKITVLLLSLLLLVVFAGCSSTTSEEESIGEVNGIKIGETEYQERSALLQATYKMQQEAYGLTVEEELPEDVLKQLEDRAFDDMVYQTLLLKEAEDRNIDVSDEELDAAINEFKEAQLANSEDAYAEFLAQIGLDEEKFRAEMKMEKLISKIQEEVTADVSVSEEEMKAFYDENIEMYKQQAGIQIYHILVDEEELANEILDKLNSEEDFSELAREYSTCGSASSGGDLGVVNESTGFVQEFLDAALALQPGEMTQSPVKTAFGYHIIKAGDRSEETITEFDLVKNSIMIQLQQQKEIQVFNDFVENLKNNADVKDYRDTEE